MLDQNIQVVSLGGRDTLTTTVIDDDDCSSGENGGDGHESVEDCCNEWDLDADGTMTSFALCVNTNGDVFTFGQTTFMSSITSRLPRAMSEEDGILCVSCGPDYCAAVDCLGRVWIWGDPQWLELESSSSGGSGGGGGEKRRSSVGSRNPFSSNYEEGEVEKEVEEGEESTRRSLQEKTRDDNNIPLLLGEFGLAVRAAAIACGDEHLIVLDARSKVWTCGDSSEGATGRGEDADDVSVPSLVPTMSDREIVSVTAGAKCCIVLERGGRVYFWGTLECENGERSSLTEHAPIMLKNLSNVIHVDAGCHHVAAVDDEGLLWMWGGNGRGQCGISSDDTSSSSSSLFLERPTIVSELADEGDTIRAVSCGAWHTAAVTDDDCLFVWGDNTYGALGTNRNSSSGRSGGRGGSRKETCYTWIPTQQRKFGRKECKVDTVTAGVHETFVITKPPLH